MRRLLTGAVVLLASAAEAATLTVPGSSSTIQGAIGMAASGDTILVAPGTYAESINYLGKNLTLRSTGGPAVTTIKAPGMTSVVIIGSGEGPSAVLDGFTITGGRSPAVFPYSGDGGGVFIRNSSPTISNNIITGNVACNGGGILVVLGAPLITDNVISANRADCSQLGPPTFGWGGGISLQGGGGGATVANNLITANTAGSGSAIALSGAGTPRVTDNSMTSNTATDFNCLFNGGTVFIVNGTNADVVQNVISDNDAVCNGGIAFLVLQGTRGPTIVNNTVAMNGGTASSAIVAEGFDATTRIVNNLLIGRPGAVVMVCSGLLAASSPIMQNNDLWGDGGVAASGVCAPQIGVNGNISADPGFTSPSTGSFVLQRGSVAIDAGLNSEPLLPTDDFAGAPRVQDGDGDGVAIVDMGAFEAEPPPKGVSTPVPTSTWPCLAALAIVIAAMGARSARRSR